MQKAIISTFTAFLIVCSQAVRAAEQIDVSLPSQSVNLSLAVLSETADVSIVYPFDQMKYQMAPALKGSLSIEQALEKLLANTRFTYEKGKNGVYVIVKRQNKPFWRRLLNKGKKASDGNDQHRQIEEVISIGSRSGERPLAGVNLAADVISTQNLLFSSNIATGDILSSHVATFNQPTSTLSDGTDALRPATLKGLAPDQVLVLVNGVRRHQSALLHTSATVGRGSSGTDLNAIPVSAIKQIEVLRDGAAAQYGSDAIAGVINIVLKDSSSGGNLALQTGTTHEGDGTMIHSSFNNAHNLFTGSLINYAFSIRQQEETDRSNASGVCQYHDSCQHIGDGLFQTSDPRELSFNRHTHRLGDPELSQLAGVISIQHYVNERFRLQADTNLSTQHTRAPGFFRRANQAERNPRFLFNGDSINGGQAFYPDGVLPFIETSSDDYSMAISAAIEHNNWLWQIVTSHGGNQFSYDVSNSLNASLVSLNGNSPSIANAGRLSLSLSSFEANGFSEFTWGSLSLGSQVRRENYAINAGNAVSYTDYDSPNGMALGPFNALGGIQVFPGFTPQNATERSRVTQAAYSEITITQAPFTFDFAIRYENVEDSTSNISQKLGLGYKISPALKFRLGFNTGFRAPSMQQLYYSDLSNQFFVENNTLTAKRVATLRNDSPAAAELGIRRLRHETSSNTSIGLEWNKDKRRISIDLYRIHIEDRITISSTLPQGLDADYDAALIAQGADVAQFFFNGVDTRTTGIDLSMSSESYWLGLQQHWRLSASYNHTEVTTLKPLSQTIEIEQPLSPQSISILEDWQPSSRIIASTDWFRGNWLWNLKLKYYGSYEVLELDDQSQRFSGKTLVDLQAQYLFSNGIELQLGVNNIFNTTPDNTHIGQRGQGTILDAQGNVLVQSDGVFRFSRRTAPFGYNGSYYFLGIRFSFD